MNRLSYIFSVSLLLLLGSCKYNRPDEPKPLESQELRQTATHTVSSLKALYARGATDITAPVVVEAVVVSDDTEGNLYKSCYIADDTGGIELKLSMGNLSAFYPQGTRVYLNA